MSEAGKNLAPKPEEVEGFPQSNRHAKIVKDHDFIRVVERHYYWDKEKGRGLEKRTYIGYVVDGVYYTMDEFRERFTRTGEPRQSGAVLPQGLTPAAEEAVCKKADQNQKLLADIAGVLEDFDGTLGDGVADEEPKVSRLTGVSVRALQYYDKIGLLKPGRVHSGALRRARKTISRTSRASR